MVVKDRGGLGPAARPEGGGHVIGAYVHQDPVPSLDCRQSASLSTSGSSLPRSEALRKIPEHALGLKKYLRGTAAKSIADKEDPAASLGDSPVLGIEDSPCEGAVLISQQVSCRSPCPRVRHRDVGAGAEERCELFEDSPEVLALVGAEGSGDVLPDSKSGVSSVCRILHLLYDPCHLEEERGAFSRQPLPPLPRSLRIPQPEALSPFCQRFFDSFGTDPLVEG